jgi:TP901-1 family phage major tail protein
MTTGAAAGADLALRIETATTGTFIALAGMKSKTFTLNNEPIETTNSDSTGRWREYLTAALSMKSVSFSGDGVFKDGTAIDRLVAMMNSASGEVRFEVLVPTLGTFAGLFKIVSLEFSGDHSDAVQFSMSAESNGAVTFTNIP